MERFTEKFKDGRNILRKGIADIFHNGFGRFFEGAAIDKLAKYEQMEEQGLLLRLPCKIGDKVYEPNRLWNRVLLRDVASIVVSSGGAFYVRNGCGDSFELGVDAFLDEEDAKKTLEKMKDEE